MNNSIKNWGNNRFYLIFWMEPKIEFDKSLGPAKNGKIKEPRVENTFSERKMEFFS